MDKDFEYEYTIRKYLCDKEKWVHTDPNNHYLELYIGANKDVPRIVIDTFFSNCLENHIFHDITEEGCADMSRVVDELFEKYISNNGFKDAYIKATWRGYGETFSKHKELNWRESFINSTY